MQPHKLTNIGTGLGTKDGTLDRGALVEGLRLGPTLGEADPVGSVVGTSDGKSLPVGTSLGEEDGRPEGSEVVTDGGAKFGCRDDAGEGMGVAGTGAGVGPT
jgi:hypothetical protein